LVSELKVSCPAVALLPDQLPLAVQLSASGALHVTVALSPGLRLESLTPSVSTGKETVSTTTLLVTEPPGPVQVNTNSLRGEIRLPVGAVPLLTLLPDIEALQAPLAVQLVALVLDQRSVVDLPTASRVLAALKDRVGGETG
jgi:hypothetical protein